MHRFLNFFFPSLSHAARLLFVGSLWASVGTAMAAPFEDSMAQRTLACTACLAPHYRHPWAGHDLPHDDAPWVAQRIASWAQQRPGSSALK